MVTPDFEDWLKRQEVDVTDEVTLDKWITALRDKIGMTLKTGATDVTAAQRSVMEGVYAEKYEILSKVGIRPYETIYYTEYEAIYVTRYVIKGEAGFFGAIKMWDIAEERLTAMGETRLAEIAHLKLIEAQQAPPSRRIRLGE